MEAIGFAIAIFHSWRPDYHNGTAACCAQAREGDAPPPMVAWCPARFWRWCVRTARPAGCLLAALTPAEAAGYTLLHMCDASPALRYYIYTWGCQMNEAESGAMARLLDSLGAAAAPEAAQADLVLLVTCCVREKPEQKVYSLLGKLRQLKARRPGMRIAVTGCMAQKEAERIRQRVPEVDLVLGPRQLYRLPQLLDENGGPRLELSLETGHAFCASTHSWRQGAAPGLSEFVTIIQGCTNFCSYCIVPYVRGPECSRPAAEVEAEVRTLAARGCREVTLLGQNVLAYGKDAGELDFVGLLERLQEVPGLRRLRFTTCHPQDLDERVVVAMARLPLVCPHLHLPIQHGDDEILRRMNRPYTVAEYEARLAALRRAVPGIAVSADLLVGFPGEREEHFQRLLETVRRLELEGVFMFAYSPRPGTAAAALPDQVPGPEKRRRLRELIRVQNEVTERLHAGRVGQVHEVLVAGPSETDPGRLAGRTGTFHQVVFAGPPGLEGEMVKVRLQRARRWGFYGELIS